MAFTTKLIVALPSAIAVEVKSYLDGETVTTLHAVTITKVGALIACLIVFE